MNLLIVYRFFSIYFSIFFIFLLRFHFNHVIVSLLNSMKIPGADFGAVLGDDAQNTTNLAISLVVYNVIPLLICQ